MNVAVFPSDLNVSEASATESAARGYAGDISPADAHELAAAGAAVLVDIRTAEERRDGGSPAGAVHVAWETGPARIKNPRFLKDLAAKAGQDKRLLLICRSGRRSIDAAIAATRAGFPAVYNVLEGFSGAEDRDPQAIGWEARGLPAVKR